MEGGIREQGAEGEPRKDKSVSEWCKGEVTVSKIDPCGICGKGVMANLVLCVKCGKWIHGRCDPEIGERFVCGRCKKQVIGTGGGVV